MEPSDAQLIEAARNGDVEAFRALYERHWRMAVGVALHCVRDRHLAEDAAQEAFAVACRRLATLRDGERFPQWLRVVCRRVAIRLRRRQGRRQPIDLDQLAAGNNGDPSQRLPVAEAIDRLPSRAREVIVLHYFSELSHEEIARTLGISTPAVHGLLQRARAKLAEWLRPEKH